jgi:hypothetical protein
MVDCNSSMDGHRICRFCGKPVWYASAHQDCREQEKRRVALVGVASHPVKRLTKAPRRKATG